MDGFYSEEGIQAEGGEHPKAQAILNEEEQWQTTQLIGERYTLVLNGAEPQRTALVSFIKTEAFHLLLLILK